MVSEPASEKGQWVLAGALIGAAALIFGTYLGNREWGAPKPQPDLITSVRASCSPEVVARGGTFTITLDITMTGDEDMTVGLGAGIIHTNPVHKKELIDTLHDVVVSVAPGTRPYEREFVVPQQAPVGEYWVNLGIWAGEPGHSPKKDSAKCERLIVQ